MTEIFQLQETSLIGDYEDFDVIKRDINCNLGSINIVNAMENGKDFEETVETAIDMLTAVSDMSNVKNAPTVRKANEELHAVGLGAMNLHGFLTKYKLAYESVEALDFANTFFMTFNYFSIKRSMEIAKEKGSFKDFDKSEYANGNYFIKYIENSHDPVTDKIIALFKKFEFYIPTQDDWTWLAGEVKTHGLYHAYRLAIAPTQSISYVQNATSSIMPVVEHIETRTQGDSTTYYPMPFLAPDNMFYYKSAYNIDQFKLIDMVATIQPHIDQGISAILFVDSNTSTAQLAKYYVYAEGMGLKSLYYTRTKALSVEECTSCAV